ncbi:hypothetical protein B4U79_06648 [Dinothrombium tinctorium]|uniref:Uncharacterized protein n=1 Tax=Dinothrombium tinctorium TaxID=1965070 RepID=A0A3S3Q855_9ACAR|nr:hypothetical protein B4U79_06648 [Dinothrombium tinctorium]
MPMSRVRRISIYSMPAVLLLVWFFKICHREESRFSIAPIANMKCHLNPFHGIHRSAAVNRKFEIFFFRISMSYYFKSHTA